MCVKQMKHLETYFPITNNNNNNNQNHKKHLKNNEKIQNKNMNGNINQTKENKQMENKKHNIKNQKIKTKKMHSRFEILTLEHNDCNSMDTGNESENCQNSWHGKVFFLFCCVCVCMGFVCMFRRKWEGEPKLCANTEDGYILLDDTILLDRFLEIAIIRVFF